MMGFDESIKIIDDQICELSNKKRVLINAHIMSLKQKYPIVYRVREQAIRTGGRSNQIREFSDLHDCCFSSFEKAMDQIKSFPERPRSGYNSKFSVECQSTLEISDYSSKILLELDKIIRFPFSP